MNAQTTKASFNCSRPFLSRFLKLIKSISNPKVSISSKILFAISAVEPYLLQKIIKILEVFTFAILF